MKNKIYIWLIFTALILNSCRYFQLKNSEPEEFEIARVGKAILYKRDLKDLYQPNMSKEDSLKITNNFIESWARRQIILQKASYNLSKEEELELEEMIKQYREDLYINSYKAALVVQNIDSVIGSGEVVQFYSENTHLFNLDEDVLRYRMISFETQDKKAAKIKELFKKNDSLSNNNLLKGDFMFTEIQMNDSIWIKYTDFINKYPFVRNTDKEQLLQSNHIQEIKEGKITHYIFVKSALRRGETAPIQFITDDIKKMIIHQKKLKYLQDLENKLIQEAIQNNTYEKY